jgi:hypothetical protein
MAGQVVLHAHYLKCASLTATLRTIARCGTPASGMSHTAMDLRKVSHVLRKIVGYEHLGYVMFSYLFTPEW